MGKKDKPSRPKGKAQPASSSRAADLASAGNGAVDLQNLGGFARFVNPGHSPFPSPTPMAATGSSEGEAVTSYGLSPELSVIVKKLSKRDSITKVRALEELEAHLKSNEGSVFSILDTWDRLYGKLALDVDRRVRLATQNVHRLVLATAKRKIAPYLKSMAGPWIACFFDPSKDVARTAAHTFSSAFPPEKKTEVLVFCHKSILDYVTEIILEKTPDTLSDPRDVTKEEMEAKFARVIIESFYTLAYLFGEVPTADRIKFQTDYDSLLDNEKFWKYGADENAHIRKAVYHFLQIALSKWPELVGSRLPLVRRHFLNRAFAESSPTTHSELWDALLLLTRGFPQVWANTEKKPLLPKLLNALRNGMNGSVTITYPSLLALFANLTNGVDNDYKLYEDLFSNFWAGGASDHIDQNNAAVFVNAYMECVVYMAATSSKHIGSEELNANIREYLIQGEFLRMINAFFEGPKSDRLSQKLEPTSTSVVIAKHLVSLSSVQSLNRYFKALWSNIEAIMLPTGNSSTESEYQPVFAQRTGYLLSAIREQCAIAEASSEISQLAESLASKLVSHSTQASSDGNKATSSQLYLGATLLAAFQSSLIKDEEQKMVLKTNVMGLATGLKDQSVENIPTVVSFLINFISICEDDEVVQSIVKSIQDGIGEISQELEQRQIVLLASVCNKESLESLGSSMASLKFDESVLSLIKYGLCQKQPSSNMVDIQKILSIVVNTVTAGEGVLSKDGWISVMTEITSVLHNGVHSLSPMRSSNTSDSAEASMPLLSVVSVVSEILLEKQCIKRILEADGTSKIFISLFEATFIESDGMDIDQLKDQLSSQAGFAWKRLKEAISGDEILAEGVGKSICRYIRTALLDSENVANPGDFVKRASFILSEICPEQTELRETMTDFLLLSVADWKAMSESFLYQLPKDIMIFAVSEPMVAALHVATLDEDEMPPVDYDIFGLSSYGRCILYTHYLIRELGVRLFLSEDNSAKRIDLFLQLLTAAQVCQKHIDCHLPNGIWDRSKNEPANEAPFREAVDISQSILNDFIKHHSPSSFENSQTFEDSLAIPEDIRNSDCGITQLSLSNAVRQSDNMFAAEVFSKICKITVKKKLQNEEIEPWINTVLKSDREVVYYPMAIVDLLRKQALASPIIERYINRLAGDVASIKPSEIFDTDQISAWKSLVLLNQCISNRNPLAMPPQRLVFLLQSIRKWFDRDENAIEAPSDHLSRVRGQYLKLLSHMTPALLEIPGSHWQYILSTVQEWLMLYDVESPGAAVVVYEALSLFSMLKDCSDENEDLSAAFAEYNLAIQDTLFDLLIAEQSVKSSKPRLILHELLTHLLEDVPDKLVKQKSVEDELLCIINSQSEHLQKATYKLLRTNIVEKAQDLAAGLEFSHNEEHPSNTKFNPILFKQILEPPNLSMYIEGQSTENALHSIFGYLLSWMLLFDHFEDITFKLKSDYVLQLKENDAIDELLQFVFQLLGVGFDQTVQPFDLSKWEVDTFDILGFDLAFDYSLQLLAAHVYFRALQKTPSLVRQWWVEVKSRQLSLAVESYTSKYFSALIISREIESVLQADTKSVLAEDENFTVKALKAVNEISAIYRVDDQNMEMAIRLPQMFPLRKVEVNGVQKIGVKEDRWRAWLLAVSAIIASQNGNLVDALSMFKRNVTMHFEGIEDCTICYSIVSVTDRSLPSKQCRTCKNKYHASCLYKWFSSSNSSSCPLCRTLF